MEKPKSITQLSKEQLEDMVLNLMHIDNEKAKIIKELEYKIEEVINYMENYISVEEYNEPVKTEFKIIIRNIKR